MKKVISILLAVVLVLTLGATAVFAGSDQIPSAKAAFYFADVENITYTSTEPPEDAEYGWATILDTYIKTGNPKDLIIDVSAECSLITNTFIKGKAKSKADARILVRVLVDDEYALPCRNDEDGVVFANRIQELTGDLAHYITYIDWPEDGGYIVIEPHELELFLSTCYANSFNFVKENVGSGPHHVEVQARLETAKEGDIFGGDPATNAWEALAIAYIGYASVIVDEANLKYPVSQ